MTRSRLIGAEVNKPRGEACQIGQYCESAQQKTTTILKWQLVLARLPERPNHVHHKFWDW